MENIDIFPMERIRRALADRNLTKVAIQTGLHENTIRAIASGKNINPTLATLDKLIDYLFRQKD
jgi:transcriptional regulator with XRE-family HTH domain